MFFNTLLLGQALATSEVTCWAAKHIQLTYILNTGITMCVIPLSPSQRADGGGEGTDSPLRGLPGVL
jgi:hypothetical protein